ncbi:unnamed protein product [Prorocentrum cordatum]|uniref:Uncharacterized protein n=1 Tax=Prorocentrum cordatum TaxID=2364126 RepID=A0ABN9X5W4_9DINO|nr:unnamed protein product [Polarella glacialis]
MDALAIDFGAGELGPESSSRLEALGHALVLHRSVDEGLGHHRHRLGDALRELAALAHVPAEWLLRCRAVKAAGDRGRHEAWSRGDVHSEKRVEDAAEPSVALLKALHPQPPAVGLAPGVWLESDQAGALLGALGVEAVVYVCAARPPRAVSAVEFAQPVALRMGPPPVLGEQFGMAADAQLVQSEAPGDLLATSAFGQGVAAGWRLAVQASAQQQQQQQQQHTVQEAVEKEHEDGACHRAGAQAPERFGSDGGGGEALSNLSAGSAAPREADDIAGRGSRSAAGAGVQPSAVEGANSEADCDDGAEAGAAIGQRRAMAVSNERSARMCLAQRWEGQEPKHVDHAIELFKQCFVQEAEQQNCEVTVPFDVITRKVQAFPKRACTDSACHVASWGEGINAESWHYATHGPDEPFSDERPILFTEVLRAMLPKFVKQFKALGFASYVHKAGAWQARVAWRSPEPDSMPS